MFSARFAHHSPWPGVCIGGKRPDEKSSGPGEKLSQFRAAGRLIEEDKEDIMSVNGIEITEIQVHSLKKKDPDSHLQAFARVILNGQLCINGIRIVRGKFGPFISFPREFNRKEGKGYNLCYPITKPLQSHLSERILSQWQTVAA
jgi:DNA-binding cell septation regulator SpoVG